MGSRGKITAAALLLAAFGFGAWARQRFGLTFELDVLQAKVADAGWLAPAIFVAIVACRQFLLLPSVVLLSVGGLVFGSLSGTLLGATGIVLSAAISFGLARAVAGDALRARLAHRFPGLDRRVREGGAVVVALGTAWPGGPMTGLFWTASLVGIAFLPYLAGAGVGGLVRAWSYSALGSTLADAGSLRFWVVLGLMTCVSLLPFLHPGLRAWLRGASEKPTD